MRKIGFVRCGEWRSRKWRIAIDISGSLRTKFVLDQAGQYDIEPFLLAVCQIGIDVRVCPLDDQRPGSIARQEHRLIELVDQISIGTPNLEWVDGINRRCRRLQ